MAKAKSTKGNVSAVVNADDRKKALDGNKVRSQASQRE